MIGKVKNILKEYVKWRDTTDIDLGAYTETEQLELYLDQLNKQSEI